jgi:ATP-dependent protease HslVU (ClpYQ) peptidase subunit
MTALIAIRVPSKALNPKRRQISCIEPGVILAADTRITKGTRPLDGDGQKLGTLPGRAIAGFSGDVYVADTALERLTASVEANQNIGHFELATTLQKQLARTWTEIVDRKPIRTTVVLGTFVDSPRLYVFDTKDNFAPQLRDGCEFAGSGANALRERFNENFDWMTQSWHNRARQPQFDINKKGEITKVTDEGKDPFPIRLIDLVKDNQWGQTPLKGEAVQ